MGHMSDPTFTAMEAVWKVADELRRRLLGHLDAASARDDDMTALRLATTIRQNEIAMANLFGSYSVAYLCDESRQHLLHRMNKTIDNVSVLCTDATRHLSGKRSEDPVSAALGLLRDD